MLFGKHMLEVHKRKAQIFSHYESPFTALPEWPPTLPHTPWHTQCSLGPNDVLYDGWMVSNPENLLIFAAGEKKKNDDYLHEDCSVVGAPTPPIPCVVVSSAESSGGVSRA